MKNGFYLGIDIGGTKCAVVAGDEDFNICKKIQFETRTGERNYNAVLDEFFVHIESLFSTFPREHLKGIGISCGGPLDSKKGMIYSPPNLPGWDNVPIVDIFSNRFGVPVSNLTAKTVAEAAAAGDISALDIIKVSAEYLGRGLAVLIDILNPECIVIGSIYSRNELLFKPHVDRILAEEAIPSAVKVSQIKPALLGESIGDFAALCVALYSKHF